MTAPQQNSDEIVFVWQNIPLELLPIGVRDPIALMIIISNALATSANTEWWGTLIPQNQNRYSEVDSRIFLLLFRPTFQKSEYRVTETLQATN